MLNLREGWRQLAEHLRRLLESPTSELSDWGRLAVYQIRLWRFCGRKLVRDRLLVVAGHLTFKTLLGLIPALVLFLLVIDFFSRGPEVGETVKETLFQALNITEIRVSVGEEDVGLVQMVSDLVEAARGRMIAAAAVGFPVLVLLAMTVLGTVDSAVNEIWQIAQRRPFWRRFVLFWLILTLGPLAAVGAVYAISYLESRSLLMPACLETVGSVCVTLGATWFVLFVLYKLIPNAPVRSRAALTGAVVAGTLWHVLAKAAFGYYIEYAVGFGQVFGTLAVLPLFFVWIYVTWAFVLFGCELACVIHNYENLARAEALERGRDRFLAADFVGLVVAAVCGRRFRDGLGPTSIEMLASATGVGRGDLDEVLGRLEGAGIIARTAAGSDAQEPGGAVLPAREFGELPVGDVLRAARGRLPVPADAAHLPLHEAVRQAYERARAGGDSADRSTVADMVAAVGPAPQPDANEEAPGKPGG